MVMETVKLKLFLHCTTAADPTTERIIETLYLCSSLDHVKVNEIKAEIQKNYDIPTCVQKIKWAGSTLNEERFLHSYGLRENDVLEVVYYSRGACVLIVESVNWLREVVTKLRADGVPFRTDLSLESFPQLTYDQQELYLRRLWGDLFQPWHNPSKYTNKMHFVFLGGLDLLVELHSFVLQNEWADTPGVLKYTEFLLLHSFWSFGETFSLQRLAINKGAMELFLKSLQRLKVNPTEVFRDKCVTEEQWLTNGVPDLNDIADGALGVLSK